jgi:two-component sensor histidine kinase/ABC-type amino acid transport substrate-binding protein
MSSNFIIAHRRLFLIPIFILLVTATALSGNERVVKIGVFQASPMVLVENGNPDGLFIDLIKHFSEELGWKPVYIQGAWGELLEKLKTGEIDLLPSVGYTAERSNIYDFSHHPVFIDSGVVYAKRGEVIHTIFDLRDRKVAALRGSTFTTAFINFTASFGIKCDIVLTDNNEEVMRLIEEGNVYAGVCIYSLGNELSRRYAITATPISFSPIALEFAVPKGKNGDLIVGIDRLMKLMINNPSSVYSRSFDKWTVARRPVVIPRWLFISIVIIIAIGLLFAVASIILRREVRRKTEHLRTEIKQHMESEIRLEQTLRENETLIRELYHRTKNTLQLVLSFISLEALEIGPNDAVNRLVQKTRDRISVITLVHQMLYKSRDLSRISVRDYITEMSRLTLQGNEIVSGRINLDVSVDDYDILLDLAIPVGLVLNELITNSIKHAFPDGRPGCINIHLERKEDSGIHLIYQDDGVGLPDNFDFHSAKSLGMQLLKNIVENQLMGNVSLSTGTGLTCEMRFPTDTYRERV